LAGRIVAVGISDTRDWANCGLSAEIPLTGDWTAFSLRFKANARFATPRAFSSGTTKQARSISRM
jgi:hypothetical protein